MLRSGNDFSRNLAVAAGLAALLGCLAAPATAAPAEELDPVRKLLIDKGLLPAGGLPSGAGNSLGGSEFVGPLPRPGLAEQVRDRASDMVLTAMNFLGVPYRRGGNSEESGFDCSGFTRHIFEMSLGLVLPRRADEQARASGLVDIRREDLRPGDLVFFNTLRRTFSHVGIYIGEGKFIHSPSAGGRVRVEDMRMSYWNARFTGARRAETMNVAAETQLNPPTAR
ncbi:C40 family peptidase [Piscinibacter sakaiensis]|uniref:NLP/P60 family protein n=1 Tax=Piscinibacter sakaiensis TaxID=1547922 RepID=A0A0K8P6V0_PISS1|nr:C40 family peptidase [Piscinibacter sakaiensis]GAP38383.1 NLP/P60 family protein [Piscinibacter sakaiensis]